MTLPSPILELRSLGVTYDDANGKTVVLRNISLSFKKSNIVCIVGASGSGKSTLLRILAGVAEATVGIALFHGSPIVEPTRSVGFVQQEDTLFPWFTAIENVMLPVASRLPQLRQDHQCRAMEFLEAVGMENFADFLPGALSGGMRQRVALARSLAAEPEVLLLDEPFGALDSFSKEALYAAFYELTSAAGITSIIVTHDLDEAIALADRIVILSQGTVRADYAITLSRPRILNGIRLDGFESCRQMIAQSARDIFEGP